MKVLYTKEEICAMSPEEKAVVLARATRFCLNYNLFRPEELRRMQKQEKTKEDKVFMKEIAIKSYLRMELYLKSHPEVLKQKESALRLRMRIESLMNPKK